MASISRFLLDYWFFGLAAAYVLVGNARLLRRLKATGMAKGTYDALAFNLWMATFVAAFVIYQVVALGVQPLDDSRTLYIVGGVVALLITHEEALRFSNLPAGDDKPAQASLLSRGVCLVFVLVMAGLLLGWLRNEAARLSVPVPGFNMAWQQAFLADVSLENHSGEAVWTTLLGTGPRGQIAVLPETRAKDRPGGWQRPRETPLPAGETRALTYNWDDINFNWIAVRGASGPWRVVRTGLPTIEPNPDTPMTFHRPDRAAYAIPPLASLPAAPPAVVQAAAGR